MRATPHTQSAHKHVLVVDDDPAIRDLLLALLEDEGYIVSTAADGIEGLAEAKRSHPDVVILDYGMPRCDGLAFALRYRSQRNPAPIVLLTASSDVAARCRAVQADGCVGKPFEIDELLETVEQLRHSHESAAAIAC